MMRYFVTSILVFAIFWISTCNAADEISYGIGTGALTSGIGVNAALRGDNHMGYIAAGCVGIGYSNENGWALPCGMGVGWIQTDLLTKANNRHGLGVYAGPVGMNDDRKARYGIGVSYVYFAQGVNATGWNFGFTPATGTENGSAKGSILINVGYQY